MQQLLFYFTVSFSVCLPIFKMFLLFLRNSCKINSFEVSYIGRKGNVASTASVATLAIFSNFQVPHPKMKKLVGIVPNPYKKRRNQHSKQETSHHSPVSSHSGGTGFDRTEDGAAPYTANRRLSSENGDRRIYHLHGHHRHKGIHCRAVRHWPEHQSDCKAAQRRRTCLPGRPSGDQGEAG